MRIRIDGELYNIKEVLDHSDLPIIETEEGEDFYLAESSEEAGKKSRAYWADMAENDEKEFTCLIGEKTLVAWALGNYAGPGSTPVKSLEEWLDLWLDTPEEHFASYDSTERQVERCGKLTKELGFTPTVAYRYN